MPIELKPIKPKRISDQIFDQLREQINRGKIKAGEQLMPERELSIALNVSRTSVRNAINRLVALGLLEQRQGQGTFVRYPDANPLSFTIEKEDSNLEDLLEVRMGLECNAASIAAQRRTAEDIRLLEESLKEMQQEIKQGRLGTEADVSFHMAISYATKNPVQINIMKYFYDLLFFGIHHNLAQLYEKPERITKILNQHTAIMEAIKKQDPVESFNAMNRHIKYVLAFLKSHDKDFV